ncbi:MAG: PAS domain S-box protein, partial [Anaerolineales bacterium]|nr:PAS domain S-box protein [Anaerolineales bacterium]
MNLALAPYLLVLYFSVSVCWFLAFYVWRRRRTGATLAFSAVMLFAGLWAGFYGLELITPSLEGKLFWFNVKRLFASLLGPCLFIFTLHYTNQKIKYRRLIYGLLLIEPIISQFIYWSNPRFGWAGTPSLVGDVVGFPLLVFDYGPWFWISLFIGYLLFAISAMILLGQLPGANAVYRKQLTLILVGMLAPWLAGLFSLFGLWHLDHFDVTTFFFPVSGFFIALGLLRYYFLGLMPVAYSAVFASIRDGVILIDDKFHIVELNPAALRLLGRKEQTLLDRPVAEIFPIWDESILHTAPLDENQTLEFYYEAGGQYRYLEMHGGQIVNNTNDSRGHVLIIYDVTARRLAEKSRQMSEDRYRTVFETNSAATVIIEEDMTISLANDQFAALSGYAREEVEGKMRWTEFVRPEDLQQMENYHRARRQPGNNAPSEYEFHFLDHAGQIKDVFVSVALVPDSTISIASLIDITDRKLAEQLLKQRADNLEIAVRAEQERSAIILQSVNDAIAVSDLELKTVYVNRAFMQLTGYTEADVLNKPANSILNGRLPDAVFRSLQKALKNESVWENELQFKRKDGTVYDAAVLIAPMRDGLGKLIGYVSSHRNITKTKRLEESRRRFITNISHELRTPVTNLNLYIDLLKRLDNPSRREQYFTILNEQIKRLESIIYNTVEIISLEDKQRELQHQPIHWETLSKNLQTRLAPRAEEKKISLRFAPEIAQLPDTMGDSQRIYQALHELIHNALNFTEEGGTIIVSGEVQKNGEEEWLTLAICDNGPGIAHSEQARIFERFYRGQLADSGHIPGTGLGLNMVKLIAQAHN